MASAAPPGRLLSVKPEEDVVPENKYGLCTTCRKSVPAEQVLRDGKVLLRKSCPDCGPTETLVSNDARAWQRKRDIWGYVPEMEEQSCSLACTTCNVSHSPTIAFVDVTNRCNMNCPICIANIRGMGFEFHPPIEYFERIFRELGKLNPKPMVELFGGEPTLRDDILDLIQLARSFGLKSRIVTNGLRLADEEYCRKICEAGARVMIAFDGRHPDIYRRLRRSSDGYEKKLLALANLKKYSRRKNTILCCAARTVNDQYMSDLIDFCHELGGSIDTLGLIPLTESWDAGTFETGAHTTREDVEHMIEQSVFGGEVEFVPAGITHALARARAFFRPNSTSERLSLGGVHPDCETVTALFSDGQRFRSINHYLKMPFSTVASEIRRLSKKIGGRLDHLDPNKWLDRMRGRWLVTRTYVPLALRAVSIKRLFRGRPVIGALRILIGVLKGERAGDMAYRHMDARFLRVVVFPFEEYHSLDSTRLRNCKAVFAYEDVSTGTVKTIPACAWNSHRDELLRKIAAKYGVAKARPTIASNVSKREVEPADMQAATS
jgi:7,8-dihydro-6-hydroxymethylpterin dimethyltransferase